VAKGEVIPGHHEMLQEAAKYGLEVGFTSNGWQLRRCDRSTAIPEAGFAGEWEPVGPVSNDPKEILAWMKGKTKKEYRRA